MTSADMSAERRTPSGMRLKLLCMCHGWCMVQSVMGGQPFTITVAEWLALPVQPYTVTEKTT